jgi:hypothetical protein
MRKFTKVPNREQEIARGCGGHARLHVFRRGGDRAIAVGGDPLAGQAEPTRANFGMKGSAVIRGGTP